MARAEVNSPDGNYRCWSTVGSFGFRVENGALFASSVHRFEARNMGDDPFGCQVRYEHKLEKWDGDRWEPAQDDSIGPQGSGFRLGKNSVYNDEDHEHAKGTAWSARRDTTVNNVNSGDQFRIEAYTNLGADPADYDDCKAEETSNPFTVP